MSDLNKISIVEYLKRFHNRIFVKEGRYYKTNSPFTRDSSPSFVVYPDNTWKCYSSGKGWRKAGVVDLAMLLDKNTNNLETLRGIVCVPEESKKQSRWNGYVPKTYTTLLQVEEKEIISYATKRKITEGFIPGVYMEEGIRQLSLLFLHKDKYGKICGGKFRNIKPKNKSDRFRVRGRLGFYVLDYLSSDKPDKPQVVLVESETSANSLGMIMKHKNIAIISSGAVTTPPSSLPVKYQSLPGKLIVDHDGNEELYQQRLGFYSHLGLTPVRLLFGKEDINDIYIKGQEWRLDCLK